MINSKYEGALASSGIMLSEITLPFIFTDKNNETFKAKSDALIKCRVTGKLTVVEFKVNSLNPKTCIRSCHNALSVQANWRNLYNSTLEALEQSHTKLSFLLWNNGYQSDCLDNAWNHSKTKHKIVSDMLAEHDIGYLVVFESHPPQVKKGKCFIPMQTYYGFNCTTLNQFRTRLDDYKFLDNSTNLLKPQQ
jgi:hypothetical protein